MFGGLGTLGDGILGFTGGVGDAIVAFDEFIKTSGAFQKVGEGIATVIQTIMTALSTLKNINIDEMYLGVMTAEQESRCELSPLTLTGWGNRVTYHERLKASYYMMQELWNG